ncbi:MAG TPA: type III-B CRISPR-associated protein Cas10/Cmr2, partial [Chitinophagales bacterium]|nr:type III-B CRISPR-associated protein Cas10/Cmr2 [Chitinophagales bacterium]
MTNNHKQYLFFVTIGPVQSFIAQARKTQDLYAGSRILSELTKAAAQEAKNNQNITLVFPTEIPAGNNSFPNRFIGTITGNFSNEQLQAKGQSIEDKVRETFKDFAKNALSVVQLAAPAGFDEQIKAHLDINWLFLPMTDNNYGAAYRLIEPYMASLKNMRIIGNEYPEAGRKCSLDGERNALFFGQGSNHSYVSENKAQIVSQGAWLTSNEGLSAVSLVKRTFEVEKEGFPSTAKVALSKQLAGLSKQNEELLNCYKKLFSKDYPNACIELVEQRHISSINIENKKDNWRTEFDEQLLFEENLTSQNIPNASQLSIAKPIQQKLKPHLTQNHYTLIAFDGDKMGALLSGEFCKNKAETTFDLATFQG